MWDGEGWVDWTDLVLFQDELQDNQVLPNHDNNSLASPCSDELSSVASSSCTTEQSLIEDFSNTITPPHFIDVGLHPAALAPPGFYRKEYYKPKAGPSLPPIKLIHAPVSQLSTPKSTFKGSQLPLTIPHAAGDLVSRPLKRRHVAVDTPENPKRQKLGTDWCKQALIPLQVQEGAIECSVSWDLLDLNCEALRAQEIEVSTDSDAVVVKNTMKTDVTSFSFKTEPGRREVECKAVFSLDEMDKLMSRALTCTGTWMQSFTHLYRCKPKVYFDDIHFRRNGVIEKYRKDNNGQAASPVNNEIYGLFFSARTLLDAHYVTVVVCENGSESDEYCKERLIPLDWENNSFLRILPNDDPVNPFLYYINKCTWIEIYYTENVLMEWGSFHQVSPTGPGSSVGGLPHNKACTKCNLYPVNTKLNKSLEEETLHKENLSLLKQ
uniref:Phytanoyl-CoA hydroxylase-interacting protein-like C-terminal domain-containing protein n=1 Tax=Ditylenchus dipsaci TaxID=166011 RepID=A0A915CL86_9BILA